MLKSICRALIALILLIIATPGLWSGAFAMSETPAQLPSGDLFLVRLTPEGTAFRYAPASNSVFDICLFPAEEGPLDARAELWLGDEMLADGEDVMIPVSRRLTAGEEYIIRLSGSGSVYVEVARHALSRCVNMPMELDASGDEYSKAVAREGDVHWYGISPGSDLPVVIAADPDRDGMRIRAAVFSADGRMISEALQTEKGAFLMEILPEADEKYYIRVWDGACGTGAYTLILRRADSHVLPGSIALQTDPVVIRGRSTARIKAQILPENADDIILWESSDESVARVSQTGRVTGVSAGSCVITAYAPMGVCAQCPVIVEHVPVESIALLSDSIRMHVGDDASLECELLPVHASDPHFEFSVVPEGVVRIGSAGVIHAVGEGRAKVTVTSHDGGLTDTVTVTVEPAVKRYRALLVGQQEYAETVAARRPGTVNSLNGLRGALQEMNYDGAVFNVEARLDISRDGVLAAIDKVFAAATEQDLSLFYITCHGYYADGVTFLQMADGSVLTANELEQALRAVPGEVIVLIDCCGSGGVLGKYSTPGDILSGINAVFGGNAGGPAFALSKYRVIASAALEQDSYRISFGESAEESDMATVFARALCEGLGWNMDTFSRSAMQADVNYDGSVTFTELCSYTRRRVAWYLSRTPDYVQSVQFWPDASSEPLFTR